MSVHQTRRSPSNALTGQVAVQDVQASAEQKEQSHVFNPGHVVEVKPLEALVGVLGKASATRRGGSCIGEHSPPEGDGDVVDVETDVDDIADGEDDEGAEHGDEEVCEKECRRLWSPG